jgi:hypothetical protein
LNALRAALSIFYPAIYDFKIGRELLFAYIMKAGYVALACYLENKIEQLPLYFECTLGNS